jgi:hypothetical protein
LSSSQPAHRPELPVDSVIAEVVAAAKATRDANIVAITAAATHDDLDALGL